MSKALTVVVFSVSAVAIWKAFEPRPAASDKRTDITTGVERK